MKIDKKLIKELVENLKEFNLTEAGLFQELGISTVVCGPGSIEQAHKIDEYIVLDELKKCLKLLEGINQKSTVN